MVSITTGCGNKEIPWFWGWSLCQEDCYAWNKNVKGKLGMYNVHV